MTNRKPMFYKSIATGAEYPYSEYLNHGKGGKYHSYEDLPKGEYPYQLVYAEEPVPASYPQAGEIERIFVEDTKHIKGDWMYRVVNTNDKK